MDLDLTLPVFFVGEQMGLLLMHHHLLGLLQKMPSYQDVKSFPNLGIVEAFILLEDFQIGTGGLNGMGNIVMT